MPTIRPLPPDVIVQIKSSTEIPTLATAVLGLLENSLDSGASKINISVDFGRGFCSVEDDGTGIPPRAFEHEGGLGKAYCDSLPFVSFLHSLTPSGTSKFNNDRTQCHGKYGTFLSSLAAVSILTITSQHRDYTSTNALSFHHSRPVARLLPAPSHMHLSSRLHGTKVTVQDLFGNLAVRVKQRPTDNASLKKRDKEWRSLCKAVIGSLLAWNRVIQLTLTGPDKEQILRIRGSRNALDPSERHSQALESFNTDLLRDILVQGAGVDSSGWSSWVKSSAQTTFVTIRAIISLQPAPSRNTQFISLGIRHIDDSHGLNMLYERVNSIFATSEFGMHDDLAKDDNIQRTKRRDDRRYKRDGLTKRQLKGSGKGVDRWPMFYIRIEFNHPTTSSNLYKDNDSDSLASINKVLDAMLIGFLSQNHLNPHRSQTRPREDPRTSSKASRSSTERSTVTEHRSSRALKLQSFPPNDMDGLGGDITFPVLPRKTRSIEPSGFEAWSRIKSSSRSMLTPLVNPKPFTTQEAPEYERQTAMPDLSFDVPDNTIQMHGTGADSKQYIDKESTSSNSDDHDDRFMWRNNVTRDKIIVNARTGLEIHSNSISRHSSRNGRSLSRGTNSSRPIVTPSDTFLSPKDGSWISGFLREWNNPVFQRSEKGIQRLRIDELGLEQLGTRLLCSEIDIAGFSATYLTARLRKCDLKNSTVIAQVDSKFILVMMNASRFGATENHPLDDNLLVLIDQHAADERIRVEALLAELCSEPSPISKAIKSPLGHSSAVNVQVLEKSLSFDLQSREYILFKNHATDFATWGILYDVVLQQQTSRDVYSEGNCRLVVLTLPRVLVERCTSEPKCLIELMRTEVWKMQESVQASPRPYPSPHTREEEPYPSWLRCVRNCPQGILDLIYSRACRGAIMFNDELSLERCQELTRQLSECLFPFQCAHGRPSMVPLVGLGNLDKISAELSYSHSGSGRKEIDFRTAWADWAIEDDIADGNLDASLTNEMI